LSDELLPTDEIATFSKVISIFHTDLSGLPVVSFSRRSAQTVYEDMSASGRSEARLGRIYVSVAGTIAGLLAVIAAVTPVIVIRRNRIRTIVIEEDESGFDTDILETISTFEASDRYIYISQENTGELIRLSFVIE
jgi:hypothetical protein